MTKARVERAAELRGIYFVAERKWLNSMVGYGYAFYSPGGYHCHMADTLGGAYRMIMEYPKIKEVA